MAKPKKRRAKKRPNVSRAERIAATPETAAKLRPCPLKAMLYAHRLTPGEYEAALQIWEANDALVRQLKATASGFAERADKTIAGDRETGRDRLVAIYLDWSVEIVHRYHVTAEIVVGWIEDHEPAKRMTNDVQRGMLARVCDWWIEVAERASKARRAVRQDASRECRT